jgi:putative PIN family toxin of toxin-antitoxin system
MKIVLDTNVLVAALRSKRGASFLLLKKIGLGQFQIAISTPLIHEYREILLAKNGTLFQYETAELEGFIDHLCAVGIEQEIFFLWRPSSKDPCDDMLIELAVAAQTPYLITFNKKDFTPARSHGINVVTPSEFISTIEGGTQL